MQFLSSRSQTFNGMVTKTLKFIKLFLNTSKHIYEYYTSKGGCCLL